MPAWVGDVISLVSLLGVAVAIWLGLRRSKSRAYNAGVASGEASVMARVGATVVVSQSQGGQRVASDDRTARDDDYDDTEHSRLSAYARRIDVRSVADRRIDLGGGVPVGLHPGRVGGVARADGARKALDPVVITRNGRGPGE